MHLLETIYQRAWADQHFPQGVVRYLRDIGFLFAAARASVDAEDEDLDDEEEEWEDEDEER